MEEQDGFLPETEEGNTTEPMPFISPHKEKGLNHWSQFGLLLGLIGVGIVLGVIASMVVVKAMMPHVSLLDLDKALLDPANTNAMKVMQLVSTVFMFFLPAILFGWLVAKKPFDYLGFNKTISWQQFALVILIAWMALYVGSALSDLNNQIPIPKHLRDSFQKDEDLYNEQVLAIAKMSNFKDYLIALFIIALVPAIVEETFFRGAVQQLFVGWFRNPWVAIIVTGILFSAIHMSYFGFLTRAMLGVVLGLLYYYGKSIWLNILAHFINNGVAMTILYYYSTKGELTKDSLDDHFPLWLGVTATIILIFALIIFKKASEAFLARKESFLLPNNIH